MKLHAEIVAELNSLITQRDTRPSGSITRARLNQCCMALAWVLEHELAPPDLTLTPCQLCILECWE